MRLVDAARRSVSRSARSTGVDISVRISTALDAARWNDSAISVGWIPAGRQDEESQRERRRAHTRARDRPAASKGAGASRGDAPLPSIFSAAPSRLPARTTTDVVPSPASMSWAAESSTSWRRGREGRGDDEVVSVSRRRKAQGGGRTMRAAGCRTAMCLRIVAPSLVMTTSPWAVWIWGGGRRREPGRSALRG